MTKDQYLRMVEQTGEEINWEKCPPELEDFPEIVLTAIEIYNSLGDRVYPDVGFVGKDFTNLSLMFDLHYIIKEEKDYLMDLLFMLDAQQIKQSQEQIKAQYDKIKK
jgi:hypothetical protein